jgi:nicotinate-nucleotide pyrophosphorylase (carboxylating)
VEAVVNEENMNSAEREIRLAISELLAEDIGRGDVTTTAVVPADRLGRARLEVRESFVLAGTDAARMCFEVVGEGRVAWEPKAVDGDRVSPGDVIALVEGPLAPILTAERTALNLLARLSGVATLTSRFVAAIAGTKARISDTRKTTPGLRMLEKYAVRVGGGVNHRFGLDDGVLIKDNHIAIAGGAVAAVQRARQQVPHTMRVEVELEHPDQVEEVIDAGADAVLLDNMSVEEVRRAVLAARGRVILEVSGGIDLNNIREYADTGVDIISVGALTHSAQSVDVALEVEL